MTIHEMQSEWSRLWLPPERLTLSEWAERNIVLSPEYSARTGPLKLYGWQKGVLDSFTDPTVETTVLMTGTQLIKTLYQQVATAYAICAAPAPILIVAPKEDDAETFAKERLEPMIRDCPVFEGKLSTKKKDRLNTTTFKRFPGGSLSLVGAGAPGNAARRSICYAFLDEVDKYLADVGGEGDFVDLVRERTATYGSRRKLILACSPTKRGKSRIGRAYELSDQREPWVPCRHCGVWQVLHWTQVRWDENAPADKQASTAAYECCDCRVLWTDVDRWWSSERAEWRARKPFTGTAGFWISHLYSPWKRLGEVVAAYLKAKDDKSALKSWTNTNLAQLYDDEGETPDWQILLGRREDYPHGEDAIVPRRGLFLTCAVDVQDDRLEYEVVAWGRGKENWSVAYGVIRIENGSGGYLKSSDPRLWDELEKVLQRDWIHAGGQTMPITVMTIDTGSRPQPVYDFAKRHARPSFGPAGGRIVYPRTVVPIKGSSTDPIRIISSVSGEDAAKKRGGLRIVSIGTGVAKQQIYDNLRLPRPTADGAVPGYCHFPAYGEEYFQGLCSEKRSVREDGSVVWEKNGRNEPLDCRVYNLAAAVLFGIERFGEAQWAKLEEMLGLTEQEPPVVVPKTPPDPIAPPPPPARPQVPVRRVTRSRWLGR